MSYLDDLSCIVSPECLPAALDIVRDELQRVGLEVNLDKSTCWSPSAPCPTDTALADMWATEGGVIVVGAPFTDRTDPGLDEAFPIGSPMFVSKFCNGYVAKLDQLLTAICALPDECSPDRQGVQAANLLLRHCCSARVAHLLRLLPPEQTRELAADVDRRTAETFCTINQLPPLDGWRAEALRMPLRLGGLGLRALEPIVDAAFIGATAQVAPHVARCTGACFDDPSDPAACRLAAAASSFQAATRSDPWAVLHMSPADLQSTPCLRAQKALSEVVAEHRRAQWVSGLDSFAKAVVDSVATAYAPSGSNEWLLAAPRCQSTVLSDDVFRVLVRSRLRLPLVPAGSTCAYFIRSRSSTCGAQLNEQADHTHNCCRSHVIGRHNSMRNQWHRMYAQAGASVLAEQAVPELGTNAVADLRVREGPAAPTRYCDVVVTHPIHRNHDQWRAISGGAAAAAAERQKRADYQPAHGGRPVLLTPIAFESFGRWGPAAAAEARRLARKRAQLPTAQRAVDPETIYRATLQRWRREVSVVLQQGNAAVLLAACKPAAVLGSHSALPHAGPNAAASHAGLHELVPEVH